MQRTFNAVRELAGRKFNRSVAVGFALALPLLAQAQTATLPSGASAVFTDAATAFGLILAAAYVLMLAITGGWITFDLVRRGAKKAAS